MALSIPATGGCACSAIRYIVTESPLIIHACHCRDCQRNTGSAFVLNLWIEKKFVEADHSLPKFHRLTAGTPVIRMTSTSGTRLWSHYHRAPGNTLLLRAGTLDDPVAVTPDVHIFTRSKLPWFDLPRGARAFDGMYKLADVWPEEKRARLRASAEEKA